MRRRFVQGALVASATMAMVAGCNLIAGIEDRDLLPSAGGAGPASSASSSSSSSSATAGSSGTGMGGASSASASGAGGGPSDAGDDVIVVACSTIYVSNAGDDAEGGCDSSKPKKTITEAIASAKISKSVTTIDVCKGTYVEPVLTVSFPVTLEGGFDCAKWMRVANYGYPTFDPTNETILQNETLVAATAYTVYMEGVSLTTQSKLDGFTIQGPASGIAESAALSIKADATPTISNNKILGGGTTTTGSQGSAGVYVDTGAAPIIKMNTIDGGSGSTSGNGVGSIGVSLSGFAGATVIQGNTISGGSGSESFVGGATGSTGLSVLGSVALTAANAIQGNVIHGGSGACNGDGQASMGIRVLQNASVDFIGNTIDGGNGMNGNSGTLAIDFNSSGAVRILGNRINGGTNPASTLLWGARGIYVHSASAVQVINNMVFAGDSAVGGGDTPALSLDKVTAPLVQENTLVGGLSSSGQSGQIDLTSTVSGAVIQNNILAGYGQAGSVGLYLRACASTGIVQMFQNNFLFNDGAALMVYDPTVGVTCTAGPIGTIDALTVAIQKLPAAIVSGNKTMAASKPACGTDSGCIPIAGTSPTTCFDVTFGAWDVPSNGLTDLLTTGWKLGPMVPCAVAKSTLNLTATVSTDLFKNARVAPSSMGADQQNVSCQ